MEELIKKIAEEMAVYMSIPTIKVEAYLMKIAEDFNFKKEEELLKLAKDLEEISSENSTSIEELLVALSRVSAFSYAHGIEVKKIARYIAIVREITRESGTIIGIFLKVILIRIAYKAKEADVNSVMSDLADRWDTMDREEQIAVGIEFSGHFQLGRFLILMDGLKDRTNSV